MGPESEANISERTSQMSSTTKTTRQHDPQFDQTIEDLKKSLLPWVNCVRDASGDGEIVYWVDDCPDYDMKTIKWHNSIHAIRMSQGTKVLKAVKEIEALMSLNPEQVLKVTEGDEDSIGKAKELICSVVRLLLRSWPLLRDSHQSAL